MQFVMYISSKNHFVWRLHREWGGDTPIIHYCTLNDLQNDFSATGQEMIEINTLKTVFKKQAWLSSLTCYRVHSQPLTKQRTESRIYPRDLILMGLRRVLGRKVGLWNLKYSVTQQSRLKGGYRSPM